MSSRLFSRSFSRLSSRARIAGAGYAAVAAVDTLLASCDSPAGRRLRWITKPALMPTLAAATWAATRGPDHRRTLRTSTLTAQALSWGGDVALLFPGKTAFLTGLGSFLAAHASYVTGLLSVKAPATEVTWSGARAAGLAWAATGPAMAATAARKDRALGVPVLLYSGALSAMVAAATLVDRRAPAPARRALTAGSVLFLVSDSILGLREFVLSGESSHRELWDGAVMSTYCAGQGLIALGVSGLPSR
jgi:uncharacterized membrane protein YhhN